MSLHTSGFHEGLALARAAGLVVPLHISMYGIVLREAGTFLETLSSELVRRMEKTVDAIMATEVLSGP